MHAATRQNALRFGTGGVALAMGAATLLDRVDAQVTPRVRRSVGTMATTDPVLEAYRQAVAAMKRLPASDRRSWAHQANIHHGWCPHGNWYFQPWHRAYLLAFEAICRSLLPAYWDWTAHRQLPAAFTAATWNGQPNPLLNTTRTVSPGASLPDEYVGPDVIANALAPTDFELFASSRPSGQNNLNASWQRAPGTYAPLEHTPHNIVHGWIGGEMSEFYSPLDAIFWLHHANCDRWWVEWNVRGNANTTSSLWRNYTFRNNFARPNGTLYNVVVHSLTDILALGYRYDSGGPQPGTAMLAQRAVPKDLPPLLRRFAATNTREALGRRPLTVTLPFQGAPVEQASLILARLLGVTLSAPENPIVRVFIEDPSVTPLSPPTGPYYVGTFGFFGSHARHRPSAFALDLTPTVEGLRQAGHVFGSTLAVQLVLATLERRVPEATDVTPTTVQVEFYG